MLLFDLWLGFNLGLALYCTRGNYMSQATTKSDAPREIRAADTFTALFEQIRAGKLPIPNPEPLETDVAGTIIFYRSMLCGTALFADGRKKWNARFFLDHGQGGQFEGSGIVAWSAWEGRSVARAFKFALCKHEKKADPGANPSRGWHPGRCTKCGLDMTVDSGD